MRTFAVLGHQQLVGLEPVQRGRQMPPASYSRLSSSWTWRHQHQQMMFRGQGEGFVQEAQRGVLVAWSRATRPWIMRTPHRPAPGRPGWWLPPWPSCTSAASCCPLIQRACPQVVQAHGGLMGTEVSPSAARLRHAASGGPGRVMRGHGGCAAFSCTQRPGDMHLGQVEAAGVDGGPHVQVACQRKRPFQVQHSVFEVLALVARIPGESRRAPALRNVLLAGPEDGLGHPFLSMLGIAQAAHGIAQGDVDRRELVLQARAVSREGNQGQQLFAGRCGSGRRGTACGPSRACRLPGASVTAWHGRSPSSVQPARTGPCATRPRRRQACPGPWPDGAGADSVRAEGWFMRGPAGRWHRDEISSKAPCSALQHPSRGQGVVNALLGR